ncbi:MAG TPA: hypothetical protein GX747_03820 [Tenericutes bacterium]|nr:hypothetical protein [Mycoplasmatota bacterium]
MNFPYSVCKLSDEEQNSFRKQFYDGDVYHFEGVWYRNQSEVNKTSSGWKNINDNRQRVIHFCDDYKATNNKLLITQSYIYVSTRLPLDEYDKYKNKVMEAINISGYQKNNNNYTKDDVNITIVEYDIHPRQREKINNYKTIDVTFSTNDSINDVFFKKTWNLHVKGIREKEKRGNPTYVYSVDEVKKYFPAQVEMGCGPSIKRVYRHFTICMKYIKYKDITTEHFTSGKMMIF